ncbi:MAG: MBL fold metallo-hydrolase [bacterium]|jgi:glyoxylase-like metal-dependent hydrolase (beta-lactamase superfamily II)
MLKTVPITERITEIVIPAAESNLTFSAFIVQTQAGPVLIDTGFQHTAAQLAETIKHYNPDLLVITHFHGDHTGGLPLVKSMLPDIVIAAHKDEVPSLSFPVERKLENGEEVVPGLKVIHVPGHTDGNIALLFGEEKALIAGDCIFGTEAGELYPPPERFCKDVKMAERNIALLLDYDFDKLLLSHGKPILAKAKEKVAALVKTIK